MEATPLAKFSIQLQPGARPTKCGHLRRFSPKEKAFLDQQLDMLERAGFIRYLQYSDWLAPIVIAPKRGPCPGDDLRFCVGYTALNAATLTDHYPLPNIDEVLDNLNGFAFYSTFDGFSGYYSIQLDEQSVPLTAFLTPRGIAAWTVLPFGLKNAPPAYCRVVDQTFQGLERTATFVDDTGRGSVDEQSIPIDIRGVLERVRGAKLKLKPRKCRIGYPTVAFVGHVISADGIETQRDKVRQVQERVAPRNREEVRAFLGLVGYYRRFVRSFSDLAQPLTALLSQKTAFQWGPKEEQSFVALKNALITAPILGKPDFEAAKPGSSRPFLLDTDASHFAIGGVLSQTDEQGDEHPIYFFSRKLTAAERNYSTTEREGLALICSVQRLRACLLGSAVIIRTDHSALAGLFRSV